MRKIVFALIISAAVFACKKSTNAPAEKAPTEVLTTNEEPAAPSVILHEGDTLYLSNDSMAVANSLVSWGYEIRDHSFAWDPAMGSRDQWHFFGNSVSPCLWECGHFNYFYIYSPFTGLVKVYYFVEEPSSKCAGPYPGCAS